MHDQVSRVALNKKSLNIFVYACIIYGSKVSFFALYDVETETFTHKSLAPIKPPGFTDINLQLLEVCVQKTQSGQSYAYEMDLHNIKHRGLIHNAFILMSKSTGPDRVIPGYVFSSSTIALYLYLY